MELPIEEEVVRLSFDGKIVAIAALDGNILYCAERESEIIFGLDHRDIMSENVGNLLDSRFDASEFRKLCNVRAASEFERASVLKTRNKVLVWADRVLASLVRSIWGSPAVKERASIQIPALTGAPFGRAGGRQERGPYSPARHSDSAYAMHSGLSPTLDVVPKGAAHADNAELSFNDVFGESSEDIDDSLSDVTSNSLSATDSSFASIGHQIALDRINSHLSLTRRDSDRANSNGALSATGGGAGGPLQVNAPDAPVGDDNSWGWFLPLSPRTSTALSAGMASQLRVL